MFLFIIISYIISLHINKRFFSIYFILSIFYPKNETECLYFKQNHLNSFFYTFINSPKHQLFNSNTSSMRDNHYKQGYKRKQALSSLAEYATNVKKTMGPKSTSRWGRRLDKESGHNFGNIPGNEDVGGCNPDYKFPESFFNEQDDGYFWPPKAVLKRSGKLYWNLKEKHRHPYSSYKSLLGEWTLDDGDITVIFDRIQSDPFAPPSNVRVRVPQLVARFPEDLMTPKIRNIASCDLIARTISKKLKKIDKEYEMKGSKRRGFHISEPTQYVLERKSVVMNPEYVEARLYVHLPANSRRINGTYAASLFTELLPKLCREALHFRSYNEDSFYDHVKCVEDQQYLRNSLESMGLVAFIANGSVLPRESGTSHKPLKSPDLKLFKSPESLEVTVKLPNKGDIVGMGIKSGVTVIVGGGYHGKTTILEALQLGMYNKVMGDGREYVVSSPNCVKIRAEDGRSVNRLDISTFIGKLPNGKSGNDFTTKDASGSTSQAAGIIESIEMGADLLLIDEDISASNFMYRDKLMGMLVEKDKEPITPFLSLVRPFYDKLNISTILISGSCGLFTTQADLVLQMEEYNCLDKTEDAKKIVLENTMDTVPKVDIEEKKLFKGTINSRLIGKGTFNRPVSKIKQEGMHKIRYGTEDIDLSLLEQIVEVGQTCTITNILVHLEEIHRSPQHQNKSLRELLDELYSRWYSNKEVGYNGLDQVNGFRHFPAGDCVMPRIFEVAAALNRLRSLSVTNFVESSYKPQHKHSYAE